MVLILSKATINYQRDNDNEPVLTNPFQSVLTPKSPLPLTSLDNADSTYRTGMINEHAYSLHSKMNVINVSTKGIEQLMCNIPPHKAVRPGHNQYSYNYRNCSHFTGHIQ